MIIQIGMIVWMFVLLTLFLISYFYHRRLRKQRDQTICEYITRARALYKNGNLRDLELMVPVNLWNQHRELLDSLSESLSLQPKKPDVKIHNNQG